MYALIMMNSAASGCFFGHIMGYGKTLMQLATAMVLDWGAQALDHIDENPGAHLPPLNDGQSQCPSQHLWPIACPCRRSSVSFWLRGLFDRRGIVLLLQPLSLLPNLKAEWKKFIDPTTLQLKLWIQYSDGKVVRSHETAGLKQFQEWSDHVYKEPTRSELTRNLLATTKDSFGGRIRDVAKVEDKWWEDNYTVGPNPHINQKKPKKQVSQVRELLLPFKLAFLDEYHLAKSFGQALHPFLGKLECYDSDIKPYPVALVFVSGTPTVNLPTDMNELVRSMERLDMDDKPRWAKNKDLEHCSWEKVETLTASLDSYVSSKGTSVATVQ